MARNLHSQNRLLIHFVILLLAPMAPRASEIRISSLNVNFHNEAIKETFALIKKHDPDIILLQESTDRFEKGVKAYLPGSHKYSWFAGDDQDSGGGFAVISKFPLVEKKFINKSTGAFGAQSFGVKVGTGTVYFVNIHLTPAGLPRPFNRSSGMHSMMANNKAQVLEIRNILKEYRGNRPTVIAGDLNSFSSMPAHRQFTSRGFVAAHLSYDANAKAIPTWKMNVDGERLQARFDHVFHNGFLETKTFEVVENAYSDHALLNCRLMLKK